MSAQEASTFLAIVISSFTLSNARQFYSSRVLNTLLYWNNSTPKLGCCAQDELIHCMITWLNYWLNEIANLVIYIPSMGKLSARWEALGLTATSRWSWHLLIHLLISQQSINYYYYVPYLTLVPEIYFYYFHCEGERKNKPLVESGNWFIEPRQSVWIRVRSWLCLLIGWLD
jgi:hypothetical protein